jgi:hypothetical protein
LTEQLGQEQPLGAQLGSERVNYVLPARTDSRHRSVGDSPLQGLDIIQATAGLDQQSAFALREIEVGDDGLPQGLAATAKAGGSPGYRGSGGAHVVTVAM